MTSSKGDLPTFVIVLKPQPNCDRPILSLRKVLKFALRQCGLRCVTAREEKPQEIPARAGIGPAHSGELNKDHPND